MKDILQTTQIESENSTIIIDLNKFNSKTHYIEITQHINNDNRGKQIIKVSPLILNDFIKIFQNYQAKIPNQQNSKKTFLTDDDQEEIVKRYLKGVLIKDLTTQFDQTEELIRKVIRNKGINIVSNELPNHKKYWKRKRGRKK